MMIFLPSLTLLAKPLLPEKAVWAQLQGLRDGFGRALILIFMVGLIKPHLLKAISLARRLGFWEVELSNVGNLGNVYRDQGRFDEARVCYEEVIENGRRRGAKHHIAFGTEQLGSLSADMGDWPSALKTSLAAMVLWRELGDTYRGATTENDLGYAYRSLDRHFEAGKSFESAGRLWLQSGIPYSAAAAFCRAVDSLVAARDFNAASTCFEFAWAELSVRDPRAAAKLVDVLRRIDQQFVVLLDLEKIARGTATLFGQIRERMDAIKMMTSISAACRRLRPAAGIPIYIEFLKEIARGFAEKPSADLAVVLAIGIEQAPPDALTGEEFTNVCRSAAEVLSDLRYHYDPENGERWTILFSAPNSPAVEFVLLDERPDLRAVGAIVALALWSQRHSIVRQVGRRTWRRLGLEYTVAPISFAANARTSLPDYLLKKEVPTTTVSTGRPQDDGVQPILLVNDGFLAKADRTVDWNTRWSLLAVMDAYNGVIEYFTGWRVRPNEVEAGVPAVAQLFGLRLAEPEPTETKPKKDGDFTE